MSLRSKLLLLVLLAMLAPALMFGAHEFERRNEDIENAKRNLGSLARYAAENLDDKLKGTVQLLHGLSRAPDIDTANKAKCSEFLAGVLQRYPQYTGLLTIKTDGELHCDSLRSGRTLNLKEREYFQRVLETHEPAFETVFGGLTGIAVQQVAYPVLDADGALKYVLLASLNLSEYAREFAAASQYSSIRILIWNKKGVLMVHHPDSGGVKLAGKSFATTGLFRFVATGATGTAAELPDLNGEPRIWALGVMPDLPGGGARIVLGVPREMLMAGADAGLRNAMLVLMAVSLLAFLGTWYLAETGIRRHISRIADVFRRVGTGDLGARIGAPYPRGELGELMAVVDRTAAAVQAHHAEIALKSRDLQRANRTLRVLSGINTLIVRVRDRDELFREACRIAVEDGRFRMAWIGVVDRRAMKIEPVATAGADAGFLDEVRAHLSLLEDGTPENGPAAIAVRDRRAVVINDIRADPRVRVPAAHLERGVLSMVNLPVLIADEAVAVLGLHAAEAGYFDEPELKLLRELAGDIGFALDHIEKVEKIDYLAYYDELTGLANRSLFLDRMAQYQHNALGSGHKLAVYMLDLERFRNINDSLGRSAGDALLRQMTAWLIRNAGDANLLARVGTDHFAIVLPAVKQNTDVRRLVEETLQRLQSHPFNLGDAVFRIAAKAGVALFPDDGTDADTLLRNAEAALRKAKSGGDRLLFYTQKMNETVTGHLNLENQLRQALDNQEFVLHYQPKVNLASGRVCGAEALIRWNDPRTGLVPPGRFIPMLEQTGLIHEVGRWAMRKALADYLRWRAAGLPAVRIAVNVSPLQLRHLDFAAEIAQVLSIDAAAANGLELEITESVIMENVHGNIASLKTVRALGTTIAIDDFGTGFSSLSYLSKLPVDTLKIDRSFVVDMTAGPEGLALVSTIINLAHSLNLNVVAEGVETEEQSRLLRLLNCDEMQGYLFSKPVPADIFEARYLRPSPAA